jgi:3-phenylpropionate/cinnamic acid dioxygenase small subunit
MRLIASEDVVGFGRGTTPSCILPQEVLEVRWGKIRTMLSTQDRLEIHELLSLHGHLMDEGLFVRLHELFTPDVVYDLEAFGGPQLHGIEAIRDSAVALGSRNPLGHHITNIVVTAVHASEVEVRSKGLGVRGDGSVGSVTYQDRVRRTDAGWRIAVRKISPRREPLAP